MISEWRFFLINLALCKHQVQLRRKIFSFNFCLLSLRIFRVLPFNSSTVTSGLAPRRPPPLPPVFPWRWPPGPPRRWPWREIKIITNIHAIQMVFNIPRGGPRGEPRDGPGLLMPNVGVRWTGRRLCGTSDVANWMLIGLPSNGTPLYCFMALTASLRRSKTTSAVPEKWSRNKIKLHNILHWIFILTKRSTRSVVVYRRVLQRPEFCKQFIDVGIRNAEIQIWDDQLWSSTLCAESSGESSNCSFASLLKKVMFPTWVHIALEMDFVFLLVRFLCVASSANSMTWSRKSNRWRWGRMGFKRRVWRGLKTMIGKFPPARYPAKTL